MSADPKISESIVGALSLVLSYGFTLWRTLKRNRGDRGIEFACITLMLFILIRAFFKIPHFPEWAFPGLFVLLFLLCLLTLFFLAQDTYRSIRRSKNTSR
jgi:FtsH-binding integral membrane protein